MNQCHVGTKELKIVLRELLIMINRHFSDEEAFMREIEYPYINHHTRIHRKIILEIEEIIISEAKFVNIMTEKLNLVVQDFIFKHTAKEDSKIVKYYEEKNLRNSISHFCYIKFTKYFTLKFYFSILFLL